MSCMGCCLFFVFFFFKQKTAYEMRISDWSSDVCSSDLQFEPAARADAMIIFHLRLGRPGVVALGREDQRRGGVIDIVAHVGEHLAALEQPIGVEGAAEQRLAILARYLGIAGSLGLLVIDEPQRRSEENTSELQSLM